MPDTGSPQHPLRGRRVLVTGASSGIGRATATALARAGAAVGLLARRRDRLESLAESLPGGHDDHAVVDVDVRDAAATTAAVDALAEALDGLDALVNSAGVVRPDRLLDADPDGWRAMVEVNVLGLLTVTRATVPHLVEAAAAGPADLVNISSIAGRRRPNAEMTVYAATKSAVHVISDGYREELAPHGVRTTIVSPGYVVTPVFTHDEHRTPRSEEFDGRMRARGMPVDRVADAVVTALATPADTMLLEVAVQALAQ